MTPEIAPSAAGIVEQLLSDAVTKRASDVHIEPHQDGLNIRLRIDGLLQEHQALERAKTNAVIARIKIMAGLDIGQQRLPQDGRLQLDRPGRHPQEFRVSSCPTLFGEKLVLRHIDHLSTLPSLSQLGMQANQHQALIDAIKHPWGMVLVTGPTGSGKTVTLYAALQALNQAHRNISTIEDPIEMTLPGINQVQCHEAIGLGFANTLRTFLRQDPDVLMVGEIRDSVTAKMAIEAAQTGHLVFSSLHTHTALATLTRLRHLGISTPDLVGALRLVLSQSLMRKLHDCKQPDDSALAHQLLEQSKQPSSQVYQAGGCGQCRSGYLGRVGVFETLPISRTVRQTLLYAQTPESLTSRDFEGGWTDLRQAATQHVVDGISSLSEMNRITSEMMR